MCGVWCVLKSHVQGLISFEAQTRGVMRRERDGIVVATCEHGQVNTYGAKARL